MMKFFKQFSNKPPYQTIQAGKRSDGFQKNHLVFELFGQESII